MRSRGKMLLLAGLIACLFGTGCGSGESGPKWPDPVKVSGKVTYEGKPFSNGTVIFVPDGATVGQGGSGQTNAEGEYTAQTRWSDQKTRDGLIPGKYKVAFSRFVKPDGSVWTPDPNVDEGPATSGASEQMPLTLSNPADSTHIVEVSKEKPTHDFEIP